MLRILVASDIRLFREGIATQLAEVGDVDAISSTDDPAALLEIIEESAPDALVIGIGSLATLAAVRTVAHTIPDLPIVALGIPEDEQIVIPCAEAGIAGYVPLDGSLSDLVEVVTSAIRGETIVSPRIAGSFVRHINSLASSSVPTGSQRGNQPAEVRLTAREREVAGLLEHGLSNKQIAKQLGIRVPTVKNHVHSILGKLRVDRRGKVAGTLRRRRTGRWTRDRDRLTGRS